MAIAHASILTALATVSHQISTAPSSRHTRLWEHILLHPGNAPLPGQTSPLRDAELDIQTYSFQLHQRGQHVQAERVLALYDQLCTRCAQADATGLASLVLGMLLGLAGTAPPAQRTELQCAPPKWATGAPSQPALLSLGPMGVAAESGWGALPQLSQPLPDWLTGGKAQGTLCDSGASLPATMVHSLLPTQCKMRPSLVLRRQAPSTSAWVPGPAAAEDPAAWAGALSLAVQTMTPGTHSGITRALCAAFPAQPAVLADREVQEHLQAMQLLCKHSPAKLPHHMLLLGATAREVVQRTAHDLSASAGQGDKPAALSAHQSVELDALQNATGHNDDLPALRWISDMCPHARAVIAALASQSDGQAAQFISALWSLGVVAQAAAVLLPACSEGMGLAGQSLPSPCNDAVASSGTALSPSTPTHAQHGWELGSDEDDEAHTPRQELPPRPAVSPQAHQQYQHQQREHEANQAASSKPAGAPRPARPPRAQTSVWQAALRNEAPRRHGHGPGSYAARRAAASTLSSWAAEAVSVASAVSVQSSYRSIGARTFSSSLSAATKVHAGSKASVRTLSNASSVAGANLAARRAARRRAARHGALAIMDLQTVPEMPEQGQALAGARARAKPLLPGEAWDLACHLWSAVCEAVPGAGAALRAAHAFLDHVLHVSAEHVASRAHALQLQAAYMQAQATLGSARAKQQQVATAELARSWAHQLDMRAAAATGSAPEQSGASPGGLPGVLPASASVRAAAVSHLLKKYGRVALPSGADSVAAEAAGKALLAALPSPRRRAMAQALMLPRATPPPRPAVRVLQPPGGSASTQDDHRSAVKVLAPPGGGHSAHAQHRAAVKVTSPPGGGTTSAALSERPSTRISQPPGGYESEQRSGRFVPSVRVLQQPGGAQQTQPERVRPSVRTSQAPGGRSNVVLGLWQAGESEEQAALVELQAVSASTDFCDGLAAWETVPTGATAWPVGALDVSAAGLCEIVPRHGRSTVPAAPQLNSGLMAGSATPSCVFDAFRGACFVLGTHGVAEFRQLIWTALATHGLFTQELLQGFQPAAPSTVRGQPRRILRAQQPTAAAASRVLQASLAEHSPVLATRARGAAHTAAWRAVLLSAAPAPAVTSAQQGASHVSADNAAADVWTALEYAALEIDSEAEHAGDNAWAVRRYDHLQLRPVRSSALACTAAHDPCIAWATQVCAAVHTRQLRLARVRAAVQQLWKLVHRRMYQNRQLPARGVAAATYRAMAACDAMANAAARSAARCGIVGDESSAWLGLDFSDLAGLSARTTASVQRPDGTPLPWAGLQVALCTSAVLLASACAAPLPAFDSPAAGRAVQLVAAWWDHRCPDGSSLDARAAFYAADHLLDWVLQPAHHVERMAVAWTGVLALVQRYNALTALLQDIHEQVLQACLTMVNRAVLLAGLPSRSVSGSPPAVRPGRVHAGPPITPLGRADAATSRLRAAITALHSTLAESANRIQQVLDSGAVPEAMVEQLVAVQHSYA